MERSGRRALSAFLRLLTEKLRLQCKDVIEDAVYAPALESVLRDHTGSLELQAKRRTEPAVDASEPVHLRLFEDQKTSIQRQLARAVLAAQIP